MMTDAKGVAESPRNTSGKPSPEKSKPARRKGLFAEPFYEFKNPLEVRVADPFKEEQRENIAAKLGVVQVPVKNVSSIFKEAVQFRLGQSMKRSDDDGVCQSYFSSPKNSSRISRPFSHRSRSKSSICLSASGDGLARPFSHRLMVGKVTPSLAANISWVSPVRSRSSWTNRGMSVRAFNVVLLSGRQKLEKNKVYLPRTIR